MKLVSILKTKWLALFMLVPVLTYLGLVSINLRKNFCSEMFFLKELSCPCELVPDALVSVIMESFQKKDVLLNGFVLKDIKLFDSSYSRVRLCKLDSANLLASDLNSFLKQTDKLQKRLCPTNCYKLKKIVHLDPIYVNAGNDLVRIVQTALLFIFSGLMGVMIAKSATKPS